MKRRSGRPKGAKNKKSVSAWDRWFEVLDRPEMFARYPDARRKRLERMRRERVTEAEKYLASYQADPTKPNLTARLAQQTLKLAAAGWQLPYFRVFWEAPKRKRGRPRK